MRRPSTSRGIEAALERALERPFLKRTAISLPLLQGALRRAMEDELKPVVPSRYTITVPAKQTEQLGETREDWERGLADYFLEVLRSNGWSAVGELRVTIAYDPALAGNQVQVAVEEPDLIHNGGTFPRRKHRTVMAAAFVGILLICIVLLVAVTRQGPFGNQPALPGQQFEAPPAGHGIPLLSWWDDASRGILGSTTGEISSEVIASPCLVVRAGSPGSAGATRQSSCIPSGTILNWRQEQVVSGEKVAGEDRWLGIGTAGPEWGARAGDPLYVWMGGLRVN